jgi:hypothetical protein
MAALKDKVMSEWLRSMGFHAPVTDDKAPVGPGMWAELNAQKPNPKHRRYMKARRPKYHM